MEAINKAKSRFRKYPELLLTCRKEGLEYASCVLQHEKDLKRNSCETQFIKYRECLVANALKRRTKI